MEDATDSLKKLADLHPITSVAKMAASNFGAVSLSGIPPSPPPDSSNPLMNIIGAIICIAAMYFAFKCKGPDGGVDIIQILVACCCSPCYLAYRLAVPCK